MPSNRHVQFHLATLYARQGKKDDARRLLAAVLNDGAFPDAAEARKLLETLR
jgi:FimV-like protein